MTEVLVEPADRVCVGCGSPSTFETPPCDEHGEACPELACVLCGWAMVLTGDAPAAAVEDRPARRVG
jgi:hypothetical protein